MFDLVISNGRFQTPTGLWNGWLAVTDGQITGLGSDALPAAREIFDAKGALVLPGGIDPHVHFRDPGFPDKEDFATGSAAAAAGGVTTVFDMPNTVPAVLSPDVLADKRRMAESKSYVDFGLFAAVDPSNLAMLPELAAQGAIAFKIFMCSRANPPPEGILDDGLLLDAFEAIAVTGRPACVHAENEALLRLFAERVRATGDADPLAHLKARPAVCESEAIARAVLLAEESGVHLHICHMSSGMGAELVQEAKARGIRVTAETGPQYLLLDSSHYKTLGLRMKMNPPVRNQTDSARLWRAVLDGTVDMFATDHAPHSAEEKLKDDIDTVPSGVIGVETTLPLMLTQVNRGRLSLVDLNRLRSEMPARIFGLYPQKGVIQVGSDADLVVVDMEQEWTLSSDALHSRSRMTPFDGWSVKGAVIATWLRGRLVYRDSHIIDPPTGIMIQPLEV